MTGPRGSCVLVDSLHDYVYTRIAIWFLNVVEATRAIDHIIVCHLLTTLPLVNEPKIVNSG